MKTRLTVFAIAAMLASGASWADTKAADKWINAEFQPSTLSKDEQAAELKWFAEAAAKLKAKGVTEISVAGLPAALGADLELFRR